jgi:hypothetical protein
MNAPDENPSSSRPSPNVAQTEPVRGKAPSSRAGQRLGLPPKRKPKKSIRLDRLNPKDFRKFDLAFFCEDCSHFDAANRRCSMGFPAQHQRDDQLKLYELTGAMALCRALEID